MSIPEATARDLGETAVRLNLITDTQFLEVMEELYGDDSPEALVAMLQRKGYVTAWQGNKLVKGETHGLFLGGYRVLYKISSGTFGRVFRGDDPRTGSLVAIKVLRRKWLDEQHRDKVEMFEREGKVGLTLQHPNIVQVLAVGQDPNTGQYFIVMEFVEGGNLRDIMNIRGKLGAEEAMRVLEETASALAYAWSRGLTHRDIKPSNILMSTSGEAKLVDFGLAKIGEGTSTAQFIDDTGKMIARTVEYAGLERATFAPEGDIRSDIFFLGGVIFEALAGQRLIDIERHLRKRMVRQHFDVADSVRERIPKGAVPVRVIALIEKMVAIDPRDRFQTPEELVEAVQAVRREMAGGDADAPIKPAGPKTVFVIEENPKLQDVFREKLREAGYRVMISMDVQRAMQRYDEKPFDALIVDAGTAGRDGVAVFERIARKAELGDGAFAGILLLEEDQRHMGDAFAKKENVRAMVRPVTLKQLKGALSALLNPPETVPGT